MSRKLGTLSKYLSTNYLYSFQVVHIDPVTRSVIEKIELDTLKITSAVFAGPSLNDFYITSGNYQMTDEEKKKYPHAGYIYEAKNFKISGRQGVPFSLQ